MGMAIYKHYLSRHMHIDRSRKDKNTKKKPIRQDLYSMLVHSYFNYTLMNLNK